ncbi:helix-turn-helix transcriptional regulator [Streptomonospora litoralis]|uniref:Transcriptional regulatory protein DegU n=1 Tax=Streptomonospora litoralis TaxID=2498135 RepID=A0A4P6Q1E1_9ACTN|nr:response regulator transcription factor [Streptomonospora litoralis]QBI52629.1 Transcriptional regulatory protein DegU [Streptomonospora litoralis]
MKVVLFIRSDLLRHGINSMVSGMTQVSSVAVRSGRSQFLDVLSGRGHDLVIACDAERRLIDPVTLGELDGRPYLLQLLGPGAATADRYGIPLADGFLAQEDLSMAHLEAALRQALSREPSMPTRLAHALIDQARRAHSAARAPRSVLTDRQTEALKLMAAGLTNRQIAARLKISENGAKRLVSSVMAKLGAHNRAATVARAITEGLIETAPTQAQGGFKVGGG